jgi:hypothetical protein
MVLPEPVESFPGLVAHFFGSSFSSPPKQQPPCFAFGPVDSIRSACVFGVQFDCVGHCSFPGPVLSAVDE